jgi:hypothetical protein
LIEIFSFENSQKYFEEEFDEIIKLLNLFEPWWRYRDELMVI